MPRPRPKKTADSQRHAAFTHLCEQYARDHDDASLPDACASAPAITTLLQSARGGWKAVLEALRAYDDPEAQAFVRFWDGLTANQAKFVPLEVIATASGIGCRRLRELSLSALCDHSEDSVKFILASSMPDIVSKSAKLALTTRGVDDREWMLKAGAVLPMPKGSQLAIQQNFGLPRPDTPQPGDQPALPPWNQEAALRAVYEAQGESHATGATSPASLPTLDAAVTALQESAVDALDGVR